MIRYLYRPIGREGRELTEEQAAAMIRDREMVLCAQCSARHKKVYH